MKIDHNLRIYSLVAAGIGLIDSLYLTWIKLSHTQAFCLPGIGDCETVNTSRYSEIFGIPIAVFGFFSYLILILILLLENHRLIKPHDFKEYSKMAVFGISLLGLLYSVYLTYIEIAVIHAICPFCVISALAILAIFIFSLIRLAKNQEA